ncbi:hypothetical protein ACFSMW_08445 [Virgibacillus halophilus]|uniref:SdpI/YhfL protein family protein n=1 Tax=Tigheibacillus halophilus TaxID=361280 RepID=A0ABU5C522_9BACI|nr:hypothetical protein [Virgibacillus halophilus]
MELFMDEGDRLNWPVVKDRKWLMLLLVSILFAMLAVFLAAVKNQYGVLSIIISILLTTVNVNRTAKLTN